MRLIIFICACLFGLASGAQTKEAEFKKIEGLFKKAIGSTVMEFKIVEQGFNERSIKLDGLAGGKNVTNVYTVFDWDEFDYYIKVVKGEEEFSMVVFSFEEEVDAIAYENKKQVQEDKVDEVELIIKSKDAAAIKLYLEELQTYTWKSLKELRTADKHELIRFITKNLNAAIDGDGNISDINACEIRFAYDGETIIIPTKKLTLHEKEFLSETYLMCYGKAKSEIKIKKGSSWNGSYVEHPDIDLDFGDDLSGVVPLKYAIKRLVTFCN